MSTKFGWVAALVIAALWLGLAVWAWITPSPLAFKIGAPVLAAGFAVTAYIRRRRQVRAR